MARHYKYGEAAKKIGIILPLETYKRLEEIACARSGDKSLTIAELIDNAAITTNLNPPKSKKELSKVERLIYETELRRGKPIDQCRAEGLYVRGKKISNTIP